MTKIIELSKKNKILGLLIKVCCFLYINMISFWFDLLGLLRIHGIGGTIYRHLKKYHNKYEGERCFVIAMGPSLTMDDLNSLKHEITFGMNSICKIYNDTEFRPTYYGIQDYLVYDELKKYIHEEYDGQDNIFISDRITRKFREHDDNWNIFPLNYAYNAFDRWFNNKFNVKISDDIHRIVYDGFSITITLLQIAMYMGFKEIYLVGADCNFVPENLHFVNHEGSIDSSLNTAAERNLAGYYAVRTFAKKNNIAIYNATRGGKLEVFERINLDDLIKNIKK